MTPTLPPIKRGDTFLLACVYREGGIPASLTGYTIRSQMRGQDFVTTLEAVIGNQTTAPGSFTLRAIDVLPVGVHECDIEFATGGAIRSTQTFLVPVQEDVTR